MITEYTTVYKSQKTKIELLNSYNKILDIWPVPFTEDKIRTSTGKTYILLCGKEHGPPLLFFHGTGSNSLMWSNNVKQLGGHFRLYLIDTIGEPGKSKAAEGFNAETDYPLWIKELLEELSITNAAVIGHARGCWLAMNSALCLPDKIKKLILLAPTEGINPKPNLGSRIKSLSRGLLSTKGNAKSCLTTLKGYDKKINPAYVEYLSRLHRGIRLRAGKSGDFTDNKLKSIRQPVLLLFGDHESRVDYREVIARAHADIPDLQVQIVTGAGHYPQSEKPELVNDLIIEFLKI